MISGHVHYIVILISNAVSFVSYILLYQKYAHIVLVFDQFTKRIVLMHQLKFMADISHLNVLLSKIYLHVNAHVLYT